MPNLTDLPTLGIASYSLGNGNTFTFNGSTLTTRYEIQPKKDAAGRTTSYSEYTLSLRTYLVGNTADAAVQSALAILTQPAGVLTYTGHGVGNTVINQLFLVRDCNWGPWPTVSTCELNGGVTTQLDWTVTWTQPTCSDAITRGAIMEYCYEADVTIDSEGYSTRDVKGFFKIPMTRQSPTNRALPDSADSYRESVVPPIPVGFTRINQHFGIDYSKQRETFAFTDIQMNPTFPAAGVLTCRASHSWASESPGALIRWIGTLSGEYTVSPGTGANVAFMAFMNLLIQRGNRILGALKGEGVVKDGVVLPGEPGSSTFRMPLRFSCTEPKIYGPGLQQVHCTATYRVVDVGLSAIINKGGLWQPVTVPAPGGAPGTGVASTTWAAWMAQVRVPLGPRGTANVVFSPRDDSIIDLCKSGLTPTVVGGS